MCFSLSPFDVSSHLVSLDPVSSVSEFPTGVDEWDPVSGECLVDDHHTQNGTLIITLVMSSPKYIFTLLFFMEGLIMTFKEATILVIWNIKYIIFDVKK